ncbi:hypothetical protein JZ751_013482 [Albula glossodonta]|uniref:39S ribosomal protein L13, mitochondrial n=1 Tax=Albula glossodonta TaxID=121402 RepID=A0A8T2MZC4_9TELE|nr:hypothetical protein JZ751_013482 [Albula glossodonta]
MSSFTKSAQPPGKIANMCSVRLQGKHKPIYHALSDCGDHVVVMNTRHIAFSGNKWEQKVYSSHSGYPGGFKQVLPEDVLQNLTEQLPQPRAIPRTLREYSQEERDAFPLLWTPALIAHHKQASENGETAEAPRGRPLCDILGLALLWRA